MAERKIFAGGEFLFTDAEAEDVFILEEMDKISTCLVMVVNALIFAPTRLCRYSVTTVI